MAEEDVFLQFVLGHGLEDIVESAPAVGDLLRLGPRLEGIAEREHVAVGADAGIEKQIPGAADAIAPFEDDKALARAFVLQMIARRDTGQSGADDQHVKMFIWHGDLRWREVSDCRDRTSIVTTPKCRRECWSGGSGGR